MVQRIEQGICGICPGNCGVEIGLDNDRIVQIDAWKGHRQGVPCVRGRHAPEIVYSPDRIKTPLKRSGPKGTLEFERISWDQALEEIARVIMALKKEYGPQCIGSFFGRGNFEQSLWQMFTPAVKGFACGSSLFMPLGSPNAFSVGSICFCSYGVLAPVATYGLPMGALEPDLEEAEIILVWGTNPATDSPLTRMVRLQAAKKRGARLLVVDPLRTAAARMAERWVPIQPGTDLVLIYGLLNECFRRGAVDRVFGEEFCLGFSKLEETVSRFTPEYVEATTLVGRKMLSELTDLFTATRKVALLAYTGVEYSRSGVECVRALLTLFALTGHLDVTGSQRFLVPTGMRLRKPKVSVPAESAPIGMDRYPYFCTLTHSGHFMEFPRSVLKGDPYKLRFLLIGGASILTSFPNPELFRRALGGLDYQVTIDRFLTADAMFADIVLPAATYFEIESFCGYPAIAPPRALQHRRRIIEPVGEAWGDYLIYARLAERLGYGHLFPQSEEEMVRYVLGGTTLEFDDFARRSEHGAIELADESARFGQEEKWRVGRLRPDGMPGFPTISGKWELTSSLLREFGHCSLSGVEEFDKSNANKGPESKYPLKLTTGARIQSSFRSQHLNIPGLVKLQPRAEALIHPEDATPRLINSGDRVRVITREGEVTFVARVTSDILPGVVELNQGGGGPGQSAGWRDSNVNILIDDSDRDPVSGFPVFKTLCGEVTKEDD
jgi:anaerobic selenocysteine-containing dehydrogenase